MAQKRRAVSEPGPAQDGDATDVTIVLAEFFARRPTAAEIASFQLPAPLVARAEELGERAQAGALTPDERRALDELLWAGDLLTLTKLATELAARDGSSTAPAGA
jgi:hypothetical protein